MPFFLFFIFIKLFSCSVVSDSLQPHGLQHSRFSCPSPSPGVCLNSCPLSRLMPSNRLILCHPFSPSFPASGCFPMSRLFASGGQSIGASASESVLPMNIQGWFPLGLTSLISLLFKGLSRVFSNITIQKHQPFRAQPFICPALTYIHNYWKKQLWIFRPLLAKWCHCFLIHCLGLSLLFFQGASIF